MDVQSYLIVFSNLRILVPLPGEPYFLQYTWMGPAIIMTLKHNDCNKGAYCEPPNVNAYRGIMWHCRYGTLTVAAFLFMYRKTQECFCFYCFVYIPIKKTKILACRNIHILAKKKVCYKSLGTVIRSTGDFNVQKHQINTD